MYIIHSTWVKVEEELSEPKGQVEMQMKPKNEENNEPTYTPKYLVPEGFTLREFNMTMVRLMRKFTELKDIDEI